MRFANAIEFHRKSGEVEGSAVQRTSPGNVLARVGSRKGQLQKNPHSVRKASTGLIEAARWAGIMLATNAQKPSAAMEPASTSGSQLLTWYNCAAIRCPHAMEIGIPMTRPISTCRKAPRRTRRTTLTAVGAQGHAHPNLAGAPLYRVCRDTIEADGSEHQRQQTKEPGHLRHGALLVEIAVNLILHGLNIDNGQIGIDFAECLCGSAVPSPTRFRATGARRRRCNGSGGRSAP